MPEVAISIKSLEKHFGKFHALKNVNLEVPDGQTLVICGPSGSGKSTLLRIMAGVDKEFNGEARPQADINIGYLPQEPQLDEDADVRGNVEQGLGEIMALLEEEEQNVYYAQAMVHLECDTHVY